MKYFISEISLFYFHNVIRDIMSLMVGVLFVKKMVQKFKRKFMLRDIMNINVNAYVHTQV